MRAQLDKLQTPSDLEKQLLCGNIYQPRIIGK